MIDLGQLLREELERTTPFPDGSRASWEDALRRGGMTPRARRPLRRPLLLTGAILALALAVPSLAFHGPVLQTVREFLGSSDEPLNAKQLIEGFLRYPRQSDVQPYKLTGIRRVISADTPAGEVRLYELSFSNGDRGSAIVGVADRAVAGASWGPVMRCPRGWALQAAGGSVARPGVTPLYVSGRVSSRVASVQVIYPDGHATMAAVANGYFLAWALPDENAPATRTSLGPPVDLIARDADGHELGSLSVRSDGDVPPSPGQPEQAQACG